MKIVTEIKRLSQEQKDLKNQRKTVNLQGVKIMEPWEAQFKHQINRDKLRYLYQAYAVMKGVEDIKDHGKFDKNHVDDLIGKYKE